MHPSDSPFVADWFIGSLRWLVLLGLTISSSLAGQPQVLPNLLPVGLAGWNIVMTLLAGLNRRLTFHREINLVVDLLAAGFYFFLAGRFSSNAFLIIILLLTATFCIEVVAVFISGTIMVGNNRSRHPRILQTGPDFQRQFSGRLDQPRGYYQRWHRSTYR